MFERQRKRIDADDPAAIHRLAYDYIEGKNGCPQDYTKALELFHRAGKLGNAGSYGDIGFAYKYGRGVEVNKNKAVHYTELAAIGGNEIARYNLGNNEVDLGNIDRAIKHFMIAINSGDNESWKLLQRRNVWVSTR